MKNFIFCAMKLEQIFRCIAVPAKTSYFAGISLGINNIQGLRQCHCTSETIKRS